MSLIHPSHSIVFLTRNLSLTRTLEHQHQPPTGIILKILKPLFSPFMMLELDEQQNALGLPDPRMYADTNGNVALLSDVTQYPSHSSLLLELSSSSSSSPSSAFQDVLTDAKGREKYVLFERAQHRSMECV